MIVVQLTYTVSLEEISVLRPAHFEWLEKGLADGKLILAGRRVPPTGGMIFVNGTLEEAKAWCAEDPYSQGKVATYDFFEYAPSIVAPGLESLLP